MQLVPNGNQSTDPDVWTASMDLPSDAEEVLSALTDPALISRWAPVSFEIDGLAGGRLRPGCLERVSGSIAGVKVEFDVEVRSADIRGLELVARGPVSMDVAYSFDEHDGCVTVEAAVAVRRQRGLTARLMRAAVEALLNAGALGCGLRRMGASLSSAGDPDLHRALTAAQPELLAA